VESFLNSILVDEELTKKSTKTQKMIQSSFYDTFSLSL